MTTKLPTDLAELGWAGMWAFMHRTWGADTFARALVELVDGGRYGACLTKQKQAPAIKELRALGLGAVADVVEQTLPQIWQIPCPHTHDATPSLVAKWHAEMAELKAAFEQDSRPGAKVEHPA
jgi:hypothetical protein